MAAEPSTPPQITPDLIYIAFVLDSSLALASEWHRIIIEYITPIMKRLTEVHPNARPRMAFVTYGCSDTLPSPVLCKRFFVEPTPVSREMKENPRALGIGLTNSGAGRGMATLEGLVAAIELFEGARRYVPPPPNRSHINHIFHITGSPPDDSLHPEQNELPAFDEITWKDIPDELKKRNINYSVINLAQNLSQYSEIHSAAAAPNSPKEPWFSLRPSHAILLAGFPVSAQKAPKRVGDAQPSERTPEAKRQRLTEKSPKTAPTPKTPSMQPKPSPVLPAKKQPQPVPPPTVAPEPVPTPIVPPTIPPPAQPPQAQPQLTQVPPPQIQPGGGPPKPTSIAQLATQPTLQNISVMVQNIRTMEGELQKMAVAMQKVQQQGNPALLEQLKAEYVKKNLTFQRGKQLLAFMHNQASQAGQNNANNGNASQPPKDAQMPAAGQLPVPRQQSPVKREATPNTGIAGSSAMGHERTSSQSGPMTVNPMPNTQPPNQSPLIPRLQAANNPALSAQMQKLFEQRHRQQGGMPQNMGMGGPQMSPSMSAMEAKPLHGGMNMQGQQQPDQQQVHMPMPMPGQSMMPQPQKQQPIWQGSLCWSGTGSVGRREMVAHVIATTSNVHESHADTWPKMMNLVPLRDNAVSPNELQSWISKHKPVLCGINAQPNALDPKGNDHAYRTLCTLLMSRNIYASASWTLPSGESKNNVIFFPFKDGIVGAFFPINGVPEPPAPAPQQQQQPQPQPPPPPPRPPQQITHIGGIPISSMPQEFLARLQAMPVEERQGVMLKLKQVQMERQASMMKQQGGGGMGMPGGSNPMNNPAILNALMAMNSMQQQQQAAQQQQQQQQQQSQHADLAFGGNVPNFGGGQLNFMNGMNMGMGQPGQQPGQPGMMGGTGLPRQMPPGMRMPMSGQIDPKLMQSFMHRSNDGGGMPG